MRLVLVLAAGVAAVAAAIVWREQIPTPPPAITGTVRRTPVAIRTGDTLPPPAFSVDSIPDYSGNGFGGGSFTGGFCGGAGGLPHPEHLRPGVQGGPVEIR